MSVQYRQNKWQTLSLWLGTDIYTEIQIRGPGLFPVSLHCYYFQPNVYFCAKLATVSALNWFASLYIIGCMTILCVIYHAIHLIMIHVQRCHVQRYALLAKKNYIYRSLFVLTRSHSVLFCLLYLYSLSQAFQPSKQSAGRKTPFFYHVTQQFKVTWWFNSWMIIIYILSISYL